MAKNPNALTAPQVAVLRWIESGCPDGVYTEGWEHRIAARALERRGLISIAGRGPTWKATMTKAGRAWLAAPPAADVLPSTDEAADLIARVIAADGSLTIEASQGDELKALERLVRASLHAANRPRGKKLELQTHGYYQPKRTVHFVRHFDDLVEPRPVPILEHVGKYNPAVKAFLSEKDWQYVSKDHLSRAARILEAVAREAPLRGLQVLGPADRKAGTKRDAYTPQGGHLWLIADHGDYAVEVREIPATGGAPLAYEDRYGARRRPGWIAARQTEFISTGRLELVLRGPIAPYDGQRFRDAKTTRVEEKLPALFAALEKYGLEAAARAEDARRAKVERERQWQAARDRAVQAYTAQARWRHFEGLVERHRELTAHRRFLDDAERAAADLGDETRVATEEYLAAMRALVDARDPLTSPELLLPNVSDPSPDDLQPFMRGWNPYHAG